MCCLAKVKVAIEDCNGTIDGMYTPTIVERIKAFRIGLGVKITQNVIVNVHSTSVSHGYGIARRFFP